MSITANRVNVTVRISVMVIRLKSNIIFFTKICCPTENAPAYLIATI
jgi:hypothetical protein